MRSHNRAIHNNRAIPSRLIRNREMGSSRVIRPKVEGIKDILSRGMSNNIIIPSRVTDYSKATRSKVMHNSKVMPNSKAILNKDMRNNKTISNRVMDNHLPGKTCRPGNCP